jgi:hypothetical protein
LLAAGAEAAGAGVEAAAEADADALALCSLWVAFLAAGAEAAGVEAAADAGRMPKQQELERKQRKRTGRRSGWRLLFS